MVICVLVYFHNLQVKGIKQNFEASSGNNE